MVITQLTGIRHHPGHVWTILRNRLGWTCNVQSDAIEREQEQEQVAR